jgi:hypothetical protein
MTLVSEDDFESKYHAINIPMLYKSLRSYFASLPLTVSMPAARRAMNAVLTARLSWWLSKARPYLGTPLRDQLLTKLVDELWNRFQLESAINLYGIEWKWVWGDSVNSPARQQTKQIYMELYIRDKASVERTLLQFRSATTAELETIWTKMREKEFDSTDIFAELNKED